MIKLQDFAKQQGCSDRNIQKHIKNYAAELEGLYERRGPNGTWLSEEACEILRSKMKSYPVATVVDTSKDEKIEYLQEKIREQEDRLKSKEDYIKVLEAVNISKQNQINELEAQKLLLPDLQKQLDMLQHDYDAKLDEIRDYKRMKHDQNIQIGNLRADIDQKDQIIAEYQKKEAEESKKTKWQRFIEIWR